MNYRMTVILKKLVDNTFDPHSKTDCLERMTSAFNLSEKANRLRQRLKQDDILFSNALAMFDYLGYEVCAIREDETFFLYSPADVMELVQNTLSRDKIKKTEFAERLEITYRVMMRYFHQPNIKSRTVVKVFDVLGYTTIVKPKNDYGKTYIVGDADCSDYNYSQAYGLMVGDNPEELISTPKENSHESFLDAFVKDNIEFNIQGVIPIRVLFARYVEYWEYHRELHPNRNEKQEVKHLSQKNFIALLQSRFNIDEKSFFGISLKKEA